MNSVHIFSTLVWKAAWIMNQNKLIGYRKEKGEREEGRERGEKKREREEMKREQKEERER